ncbi:TRAP transporter small permease [Fodinicurvata fenggangensis]|uniref:TRAP transporter small permease n=1 Tax=Fodinicurvata fenggangensis TaxID=1121830 RepID=UPI00138DE4A0|nr:TRAP transporter small permease [Fodinicurvata fenggangensis]
MRALVWLDRAEEFIAVALFGFILTIVFAQVLLRYVFDIPVFWIGELARYSYVWMAFVAGVFVTARRSHVKIDILDYLLGRRWTKLLECFATLCVTVACLVLVVGSWEWLMNTARPKSSALRMPMIYLYGVVWCAFLMMIIHSLINLFLVASGRVSVEQTPLDSAVE